MELKQIFLKTRCVFNNTVYPTFSTLCYANVVWIGHATLTWSFYWNDTVIQLKIDSSRSLRIQHYLIYFKTN